MKKEYIGDGVYVDVERGMIKLTTENGIRVTNTIYLEHDVWRHLSDYVWRHSKEEESKREKT